MKKVQQLAAGLLITVGSLCLIAAGLAVADRNPNRLDRNEDAIAGLILGLPSVTLGGWFLVSVHRKTQQAERDRIQGVFFQLLKAGNGKITPLRLSMEAGIPGELAKAYLDDRARVFDANFEVDTEGSVLYRFSLGEVDTSLLRPSTELTFDVILQQLPKTGKSKVEREIRQILASTWKDAKIVVKNVPYPIKQNVSKQEAEQIKATLEAVNATVLIVLHS